MVEEGEYFVRKRFGRNAAPWGVYQRIGGQDVRVTQFRWRELAESFAASKRVEAADAPE